LGQVDQAAANTTPVAQRAVDILLTLRPQARPNGLVLQFALEQFLPQDLAGKIVTEVAQHPVLIENRSVRSRSNEPQNERRN